MFGGDFIATIPGDRVKESGLDYFVEVVNGTVRATDPPDTAAGLLYQPVAAPTGVILTPRPVGGGQLEAGAAFVVEVTLPQGSEFVSGVVRYREGGQAAFDSTDVSLIPADVLGVPVLGGMVPATRGQRARRRLRSGGQDDDEHAAGGAGNGSRLRGFPRGARHGAGASISDRVRAARVSRIQWIPGAHPR